MFTNSYKSFLFIIALLASSFMFIGGDCGTESDPPAASSVAAPTGVNLLVDANAGGGSFAVISWTHSADQGDADFSHYRVVTYTVDSAGTVQSTFDVQDNVPKTSTTQIVNSISRGTRYRSYVWAVLSNGTRSDSVATRIYGGVYFNNDGSIDEFSSNGAAESGFGWDPNSGAGTQYAFTSSNFAFIDLHLRSDAGNNLLLYSPNVQGGNKTTLLGLVGAGEAAFDKTDLEEPTLTSISVAANNVYLLKTQENNYIKVWVKAVNNVVSVPPYDNVTFDYKVQPIEGLRVVKR
jgi:hypothetical protein